MNVSIFVSYKNVLARPYLTLTREGYNIEASPALQLEVLHDVPANVQGGPKIMHQYQKNKECNRIPQRRPKLGFQDEKQMFSSSSESLSRVGGQWEKVIFQCSSLLAGGRGRTHFGDGRTKN